ncbi:MAG TPA: DUF2163 domain-containing protein, partial [Devosia sp.]|nr:DUF2163 domain-containing protein [Devosia sp.]
LGFTDHDVSIVFGGVSFVPAHGLDSSEISAKKGAQIDTSEVLGILHSSAISEDDISLGRFDSAKVTTYRVNWRNIWMREKMRVDTIGEIVRADGIFRAELRSQQQALNIVKGRRYQYLCDVMVGASRCGIDTQSSLYKGTGIVVSIESRTTLTLSGLGGFASGWFAMGRAIWTSGKRIQLNDGITSHKLSAGIAALGFSEPLGDWVKTGDSANVFVGCDRRFSTCKDKFSNEINYQGFPHIPGNDHVFSYLKSGDSLDGEAIIK